MVQWSLSQVNLDLIPALPLGEAPTLRRLIYTAGRSAFREGTKTRLLAPSRSCGEVRGHLRALWIWPKNGLGQDRFLSVYLLPQVPQPRWGLEGMTWTLGVGGQWVLVEK